MPRKLDPGLSATYSIPRAFKRSTIKSEPYCAAIEPPRVCGKSQVRAPSRTRARLVSQLIIMRVHRAELFTFSYRLGPNHSSNLRACSFRLTRLLADTG